MHSCGPFLVEIPAIHALWQALAFIRRPSLGNGRVNVANRANGALKDSVQDFESFLSRHILSEQVLLDELDDPVFLHVVHEPRVDAFSTNDKCYLVQLNVDCAVIVAQDVQTQEHVKPQRLDENALDSNEIAARLVINPSRHIIDDARTRLAPNPAHNVLGRHVDHAFEAKALRQVCRHGRRRRARVNNGHDLLSFNDKWHVNVLDCFPVEHVFIVNSPLGNEEPRVEVRLYVDIVERQVALRPVQIVGDKL